MECQNDIQMCQFVPASFLSLHTQTPQKKKKKIEYRLFLNLPWFSDSTSNLFPLVTFQGYPFFNAPFRGYSWKSEQEHF